MRASCGRRMVWLPVELRAGSRPREVPAVMDPDDVQRRFYCARYQNCLSHAAAAGWSNWTCTDCGVDETISLPVFADENEHIADLLREIAGPRAIRLRSEYFWVRK